MTSIGRRSVSTAMFIAACSSGAQAQVSAPARNSAPSQFDSTDSVREFAKAFLSWYASPERRYHRAESEVLGHRPAVLTASLAAALRSDSAARADTSESREWVNWDLFLNGQDPCPGYAVTSVLKSMSRYDVGVACIPYGRSAPRDTVHFDAVWNVVREGDHWAIDAVFIGPRTLKYWLCKYAQEDTRVDRRPKRCW